MTTPEIIQQLVQRFEEHKETYRSGKYNETQLRREFLDPFFEALGWDVFNRQSYAEMYKDVIHEDSLEIEGENKAPDYAFRIGGQRKFFLEAKKPAVRIETDIHPAFQLRRYAWSAKLPLSILSDFEELAIYDCRSKPDKKDKASVGRVKLYSYKDYAEKWDEISSIFSREAVLRGSFDAFAEGTKLKKGTAEVDDAFLAEIERWRDLLATNIAIKNESLSVRELNYAVQMTIDRIVFLRICEDRGVERDEQLKEIGAGAGVYEALCLLFKRADARYNSGLFHFSEEKDASSPTDTLTLNITIDDKPLKDIIKNLYYPESPYVFREIPADILGQVYERFLGKVIRLTAGHRAKVEEKPEVRKAGGVYYTPTYIVEYIVENTVGKLLEGKTPKEAEKIRVLDPACGSGTFPLGAYQYLLDWHLKWYMDNDPEKWATGKKPVIFQTKDGYKLTTSKKKDILLNNIYGVDIDPQAVEVTKLSLLLKVLEGESHETIGSQLAMFQERVLPDLGKNIKCGNSLIGNDYYEGRQLTMLVDEEERYRVNAFDWKAGFPQVFIQGGFDAVIGNPPYRMLQPHNTEADVLEFLRKKYLVAEYKMELFHMFLQLGISLLNKHGYHGYIIPATILNNVYAETLRKWILERCRVQKISVANERIFADADVHTFVVTLQREEEKVERENNETLVTAELNKRFVKSEKREYSKTKQKHFSSLAGNVWNILITDKNADLILRLNNDYPKIGDISEINRGLITGDKEKYFSNKKVSNEYVPIIGGSDVNRYIAQEPSEYVLFVKPKGSGGSWDPEMHLAPHKIVIRQIGTKPMASLIREPIAVTGNLFTIRSNSIEEELYILGIVNSKLIEFFWKIMFTDFKSSFPQVTIFSLSQLPIRPINFDDPADKARHDKLVSLVERMLALHKQSPRTPQEQEMVKREIESTDRGIDGLVYELYGLSEEEIKIVEG